MKVGEKGRSGHRIVSPSNYRTVPQVPNVQLPSILRYVHMCVRPRSLGAEGRLAAAMRVLRAECDRTRDNMMLENMILVTT
jgi:hypothetical protein